MKFIDFNHGSATSLAANGEILFGQLIDIIVCSVLAYSFKFRASLDIYSGFSSSAEVAH